MIFYEKPGKNHGLTNGKLEGFHTDKESLINPDFDNEHSVEGDEYSGNQKKQKPSGRVSHKMAEDKYCQLHFRFLSKNDLLLLEVYPFDIFLDS